jgi:putative protease
MEPVQKAPPRETELLAPAGDWACVRAAVANGADAVYLGLPRFNARLRAENFTESELPEVVAFCHRHGVKTYVVLNTLVFTSELNDAADYLRLLNRAKVDALIVQDVGLVRLAAAITPQLAIHASTQMTVTSPEGAEFARSLGVERVVLARELSLRELEKFANSPPLEVFVHGALCVAYSGQCLTSESLGQRSANRGECAQACRMPYSLIVDGSEKDLGDRRYLLSPQDLAAANEIPRLIELGVVSFKIEGRLKSPEYVAAVCQVYRKAIDAALENRPHQVSGSDLYQMEMTFSRGLFSGWMHGVNHQELVSARFGKKRGPLVGRIHRVGSDHVELVATVPLSPGDGIVFDTGGDTEQEQGGRIYEVRGNRLFFQHHRIDFRRLNPGDRVWKTDDPSLEKRLQQSFAGNLQGRRRTLVNLKISGAVESPLRLDACLPEHPTLAIAPVLSQVLLQEARTAPLTPAKLRDHLGKLGDTPYALSSLDCQLSDPVILPISAINQLRRALSAALDLALQPERPESPASWQTIFSSSKPQENFGSLASETPQLSVLCRTPDQIQAALDHGVSRIYADFEDIRRYNDAVQRVRDHNSARPAPSSIFLATPRIQKAGEQGFFKLIENAHPDGVLIRNIGAIDHFRNHTNLRRIGDFSLNTANPLTAQLFRQRGMELVTVSYDLNLDQVLDLTKEAPAHWFELTLHQHMPMFHMEHCVFAAFLSEGKSFLDCGRPCEKHRVHLRDRVGMQHPLRADVGCRNTLFNAVPQTGARFYDALLAAGLRNFRIELLEHSATAASETIAVYQALISGQQQGEEIWRTLRAQSQLGVTRGTL